ncbi:relaxase/mobilization nuclease domain-containing protein [Mucilaginibacter sp. dw_454]|uniref:relaxase/mobilization nuclease domain-containing protein n=1 Tax=Mucilaginibacter sp. dw_454 TaxID=2720079 RepID=UPI001BD3E276|nr:relaxase/mobilization nuclease domain-containing protein [Mucilaginibacter sp. dw_454]
MVIKILESVKGFGGVAYSLRKIDRGKAEMMTAANFGMLGGFSVARAQDYEDYFEQLASLNKKTIYPQLHAVVSCAGRTSTNKELTVVAEKWLKEMGYGDQPYLIFFHTDTDHNHVHIVSCRIDRNGKKIDSSYEHDRSQKVLNKITGRDENLETKKDLEDALNYKFSTKAQFAMILESKGYVVRGGNLIKYGRKLLPIPEKKIKYHAADKQRTNQLKAIFEKYRHRYSAALSPATVTLPSGYEKPLHKFRSDLADFLKVKFGLELVFHASEDKPAYGYTVIDHAQKRVFKGSEIMVMAALLEPVELNLKREEPAGEETTFEPAAAETSPAYEVPIRISIAEDVDDQQIHGMRRRRQKKARTNTR